MVNCGGELLMIGMGYSIFITLILTLCFVIGQPIIESNITAPKIDNQLDMLKADIYVYKSLRKDNSAPESLEDLTKPILEFESKDGTFHNPVLDLERVYMRKDKDGNICSSFGGKVFNYELNPNGSGTISYVNCFKTHKIEFY